MQTKIVAIHQPNFFPWLGFFHKIHMSDIFVNLNHVENNPRTAIYTKRVRIIANKQELWLTCSLKNEPDMIFVPINKMIVDKPERLKDKHLKTWDLNYKKAPFYSHVIPLLEDFYNHPSLLIAERNFDFISSVCDKINIKTPLVNSDKMEIHNASNQLLIDIVKHVGGNTYMPGGGADGYQDDELFGKNNIGLKYQNFQHPVYKQFNSAQFIAGLSILDAIANLGFEQTESLIKNA